MDLILVQFAILVFPLALILEGHDDETNEDVHHKEVDHHYESDVVNGDPVSGVFYRSVILLIRIDRDVKQAENKPILSQPFADDGDDDFHLCRWHGLGYEIADLS